MPFINFATTLLAAADASVGGKTAIDTPLATNTIGLFNQPQKVYIDIAAWKTLPQRQMASGMAETIKHACLGREDMFEFIEENLDDIYSFKKFACEYIAENNCRIKYNVVMKDEREAGLRETLNLGHTVGGQSRQSATTSCCMERHCRLEWQHKHLCQHALAICQRSRQSA